GPRPASRGHPSRSRSRGGREARRARAPTEAGRSPLGGPLLFLDELLLLALHLLHELLVGRSRDDLVELRPVVRDQADALDEDVVDEPLVAAEVHPVVDGDLGLRLGDQARLDDRAVGVGGFAHESDLLPAVELDLRDVGALEQIGEELDELVALGLGAGRPVARERALGRLAEVEDVLGHLADRGAAILRLARLLELRVVEDLDGPIDLGPELVGGRTRPDLPRAGATSSNAAARTS